MPSLLEVPVTALLAPLNPDAFVHEFLDIPTVTDRESLIDAHRQLLDMEDHPAAVEAAQQVFNLSTALESAKTQRALTMVATVFRTIVTDLRAPIGTRLAEHNRFAKARAELNHLYLINRADRVNAANDAV